MNKLNVIHFVKKRVLNKKFSMKYTNKNRPPKNKQGLELYLQSFSAL